jgi:hypothetical protein
MTRNLVSTIVLTAGTIIALFLSAVTLVALKLRQNINRRAVRLLVTSSAVLIYVISPLAFDAVVLSLFQRKGFGYIAVDLAWWVGLAPSLFALVAVTLVQVLRSRRHSTGMY